MKGSVLLFLLITAVASLNATAQTARRTITNDDLEKYREKRVQAEADYRANYQKLGLPSPEELERREAERRAWHDEYARNRRAQNSQTADYYRAQANQLKSQIAGVQGQINYLRSLIGNTPPQNPLVVTTDQLSSIGVLSSGYFPAGVGAGGRRGTIGGGGVYSQRNSQTFQGPNVQTALNNAGAAPNPYAGTALARTGVRVVTGQQNTNRRGSGGGRGYYPRRPVYYGGYYGVPYVVNNNSSRDEMIAQLRYLEQVKAGLLSQFGLLQDEARRAGVKID